MRGLKTMISRILGGPAGVRSASSRWPDAVHGPVERLERPAWEAEGGDCVPLLAEAKELCARYPDNFRAWCLLGRLHQRLGMTQEAVEAYSWAVRLENRPAARRRPTIYSVAMMLLVVVFGATTVAALAPQALRLSRAQEPIAEVQPGREAGPPRPADGNPRVSQVTRATAEDGAEPLGAGHPKEGAAGPDLGSDGSPELAAIERPPAPILDQSGQEARPLATPGQLQRTARPGTEQTLKLTLGTDPHAEANKTMFLPSQEIWLKGVDSLQELDGSIAVRALRPADLRTSIRIPLAEAEREGDAVRLMSGLAEPVPSGDYEVRAMVEDKIVARLAFSVSLPRPSGPPLPPSRR